jgi:integrase
VPRRPGSDGSIKESPAGSGWYRALLPPRLSPTGKRTYIEGRWQSKTQARRALNRRIAEVETGRMAVPVSQGSGRYRRVRDVVESYITHRQHSSEAPLAVKTARGYKSDLKNHINNPHANIGNVVATRLTAANVQKWMQDLAAGGVKPATAATAKRLLSAAMAWEARNGRIPFNPVSQVRKETSKAGISARQSADQVLLPSWSEFAALVQAPAREEDRLLVALIGWSGLRWSEAASLDASAVWGDRPVVTISRVLTRRTNAEAGEDQPRWVQEAPKGGLSATVTIPTPLWRRLLQQVQLRRSQGPFPSPADFLLFSPQTVRLDETDSIGIWDNSNFRRQVWAHARDRVGLTGDTTLSPLNPRRRAIRVKDLRAFAASVLLDSGASMTEAAMILRHTSTKTTEKHYARAMNDLAYDQARRSVSLDRSMDLGQRIDALWDAWAKRYPESVAALGIATAETQAS